MTSESTTGQPRSAARPGDDEAGPVDHAGMLVVAYEECYELLASKVVGRIAFVDAGVPVILPVNYGLDGRDVLLRTAIGSKLDVAIMRRQVAFEVDDIDEEHGAGWSVLLRGTADTVAEAELASATRQAMPDKWAQGVHRTHWVRVRPIMVTGRRVPARVDAGG